MANHERTNAAQWDPNITSRPSAEEMAVGDEWHVVKHTRPDGSRSKGLPAPIPDSTNLPSVSRRRVPRSATHKSPARHQPPPRPRHNTFQELLAADEPVVSAETAWRENRNAADVVRIPLEVVLHDKKYEGIAREHGTYIHTLLAEHRENGHGVVFGIWGAPQDVAKAKKAILDWLDKLLDVVLPAQISQPGRFRAAAKFAKIYSLTPRERLQAEREWRMEVQKQKFRQRPPDEMPHHSIGHFHWPDDDFRPDEVWGKTYEALDPIRIDCNCYVVWIQELAMFRVMGEIEDVKCALHRIRMAFFQVTDRDIGPVHLHVLRVPEGACMPDRVAREPYHDPLGSTTFGNVHSAWLLVPMINGQKCSRSQQQSFQKQAEVQAIQVKHLVTNALKQLHYYRGRLELRFRLGRLLLERVIEPQAHGTYMRDEYLEMTKEPQFGARVTESIGHQKLENKLLKVMRQADHLLIPLESIQRNLSDVRPSYHVSFTFQDPAGDICLSIKWSEQIDTRRKTFSLSSSRARWTRFKPGDSRPTMLMNMSMTNLETGLAWALELLSSRALDEKRLPSKLLDFAEKVSIDPEIMTKTDQADQRFIKYPPFLGLKSVRQMITWQFGITKTDYSLDCTKFNDTVYDPTQPRHPPKLSQDSWSLGLESVVWNRSFAQNESLAIGERADWEDDFAQWFDKDIGTTDDEDDVEGDSPGFEQLLGKLDEIEGLLLS